MPQCRSFQRISGNMFGPTKGFSKSIGSGFRPKLAMILVSSARCALLSKRRSQVGRWPTADASSKKRRDTASNSLTPKLPPQSVAKGRDGWPQERHDSVQD
jgi:hypothetical protein